MGLETVEILMQVEDHFDIRIPDDRLAQIRTVDDLNRCVLQILQRGQALEDKHRNCPSIPAFVSLRRELMQLTGANRRTLRPRTSLARLIPVWKRRRAWRELTRRTRIGLPSLLRPPSVQVALACLPVIVASLAFAILVRTTDSVALAILPALLTIFVTGAFGVVLTRPLAVCFPDSCLTLADAVRLARPPEYPAAGNPLVRDIDPDQVATVIVSIVADVTCLPVEKIEPGSRFVEDLACG